MRITVNWRRDPGRIDNSVLSIDWMDSSGHIFLLF